MEAYNGLIDEMNYHCESFVQPKAIYAFNTISIKTPKLSFTGLEQIVLKLLWKPKGAQITTET